MFVYVADQIQGPYKQLRNFQVMAYQQGWVTPAYFAAFYPTAQHGMLVNHQVVAPGGGTESGDYIAPLKSVHIDPADGALRLAFWPGNNALKGTSLRSANMEGGSGAQLTNLGGNQGFVALGSVALPTGGALSLCPCGTALLDGSHGSSNSNSNTSVPPAAVCSSVAINGSTLVMTISFGGQARETIDRDLTHSLVLSGTQDAGHSGMDTAPAVANFTLLQRRGMWEFYLGGFLALPERLPVALSCIELQSTGGMHVAEVFNMTSMPANTPVKPAPTYPHTPQ